MTLTELFTNIANAIRSATGTTGKIKATDFAKKISAITNRGSWGTTINPGGSVTIPSGYHNGSGVVRANNATASLVEVGKGTVNGRSDKNISATVGHYIATSVVSVKSGATRILWGDGVWGVNIYQVTSSSVSLHNGDGNSGGYVIFRTSV